MLMDLLNRLSIVVSPVFYKLLYISITGVLLGGAILIIRKLFDKHIPPIWKYLMWTVVILGLLIPIRLESNITLTEDISKIEGISFREEYEESLSLSASEGLSGQEMTDSKD